MIPLYYFKFILLAMVVEICLSKIIIVGSGPAGIAAATKLLKNNVSDILILEAENRIGGRINSIYFGDAFIDLGAEWCVGQEDNVVYNLVKDYNLLQSINTEYITFYSDGKEVEQSLNEQLFKIIDDIYTASAGRNYGEEISIGLYCSNRYFAAINNITFTDTRQRKIAYDFLDLFQRYVTSEEGAFSWFEPSANTDFQQCTGDQTLNWNGKGFKTVLDVMMQKFPSKLLSLPIDDKIILNKEVNKILWNNVDDNVIVKCSDGSSYHADQVIFTPSVGVLKEKHKELFEPRLPIQKQTAIEKIGIGAVMKIMLLFEDRWWPTSFTAISFVWSEEDKNTTFARYTKHGKTWIFDGAVLLPMKYNPKVLSFWFSGETIPIIEQLSNAEVLEGVNFILDKFLKSSYNLTYPISILKTQWYTNPHFRGTYSYQTVASRELNSNYILGEPLHNANGNITLMFAGEATHMQYYATVHGAIQTGYREADRLLKIIVP